MASTKTDVTLQIKADLEQARAALKRLGANIGDLDTTSKKADASLDGIGKKLRNLAVAAGVGVALRAIFNATIESENALAQLDARLKSTGGAAGLSREQLIAMATALQNVTTFSDEAVLGAETIIQRFTRIGRDVFPGVVKAALDVAAATGKSLPEAAEQMGRAFNNPIRGMRQLEAVGVHFTAAQKDTIKALDASGRAADIHRMFLDGLAVAVGGTAEKLRGTLGGALQALKVAFDNLLEGDVGPSGLAKDINELTDVLNDPATQEGMKKFTGALTKIAGFTVAGTGAIAGLAGRVVAAFQAPEVGDFLLLNHQISQTEERLAALQKRAAEAPFDKIVAAGVEKAQAKLVGLNDILKQSLLDSAKAAGGGKPTGGAAGPEDGSPPPTINKKYDELLARLREQAALQGEAGEAAKVRYAIEHKQLGELDPKQQALLLKYAQQIDAHKQGAEASKKQASELEALQKSQLDYVAGLEKTAATVGLTTDQVARYELAEKGLTGALRARAEAALATIAADEQKRQSDADAVDLLNVQIALLRAQGREREAAAIEAEQRFGKLRERQAGAGNQAGVADINNLVAIEQSRARLAEVQAQVDAAFEQQTRGESSIQADREAGLISEIGARRELVALHGQTATAVEKLLPEMRALAEATGDPAAIARVQKITDEVAKLKITADATGQALRAGFESGLTRALEGLIDGTLTLRGALSALFADMARSMAQLAAQNLAQEATAGLVRLFGGGAGSQGAELVTGAAAVTSSATALAAAGGTLVAGAAAITAAAATLTGSGAASGGGTNILSSIFSSWFSSGATAAAEGGHIRGPGTSTSDSIPALLSDNEFVARAAVVTQPGALPFLHDFNRRGMQALDHWSRHATGGLAGFPAPAMAMPSASPSNGRGGKQSGGNTRILNFVDKEELMRAVMNTPAGDKFVINAVLRNRGALGLK